MNADSTKLRSRRIYELRIGGMTFTEIGATLKMSSAQASNIFIDADQKNLRGWLYGDWSKILIAKAEGES